MLIEIRSQVFRSEAIKFHEGLNVVLGDENATNSIGKSSLLMVIDFAFGGSALLEHNTDLVQELGHHYYFFTFKFEQDVYRFRRGTSHPDLVYRCGDDFEVGDAMSIAEYRATLNAAYGITLKDLSFRTLVSLYMRIWGKENLNVRRPLHVVPSQPGRECVNNLIKIFNRYDEISGLTAALEMKQAERKALQKAFRNEIVPKISKRDRRANEERIAQMEEEIEEIKSELAKYATNISVLVNREVLELKIQKDQLVASKLIVDSKLLRVRRNLESNRRVKGASFAGVADFFPAVNQDRLQEVEEFHDKLVGLLRSELRASEKELREQLDRISSAINVIDEQLGGLLKSIDQPTVVVDRVFKISEGLSEAKSENKFFDAAEAFRNQVKELSSKLSDKKLEVLQLVQSQINDEMQRIVSVVFGNERKSPKLELRENSYTFEVFEDTGTGTAYAGLVIFDLAVFLLTVLPVVAHDSILYKNIENDSVARLFKIYESSTKQSFVAIDEISKYGSDASNLLRSRSVLQLTNDSVLFVKDWRKG